MEAQVQCLSTFEVGAAYSTSDSDLLDDFLVPALTRATTYDRAVGYFSSSLIALVPHAMTSFVERGGKMRLVCSPHLSSTDIAWLGLQDEVADAATGVVVAHLLALAEADDLAGALIASMASLVHHGALEVKFARPAFGTGLFHDKVGVFEDSDAHRLSFVGSANETAAAWSGLGNHEQIETFASWLSDEQDSRAQRHAGQFQELWVGVRRGVRVCEADASAAILREVNSPEPLDIALDKVREIVQKRRAGIGRPTKRPLKPHQEQVLASWRGAGRRGVVVFATGGGKTLTGLAAVREWAEGGRPAVVGVPSKLLHSQWLAEPA